MRVPSFTMFQPKTDLAVIAAFLAFQLPMYTCVYNGATMA